MSLSTAILAIQPYSHTAIQLGELYSHKKIQLGSHITIQLYCYTLLDSQYMYNSYTLYSHTHTAEQPCSHTARAARHYRATAAK
jgi:hypothetical protein